MLLRWEYLYVCCSWDTATTDRWLWERPHMEREGRTWFHELLEATTSDHVTAGSIQWLSWKSGQKTPRLSQASLNSPLYICFSFLFFFLCCFFLFVFFYCKLLTESWLKKGISRDTDGLDERNAVRLSLWQRVTVAREWKWLWGQRGVVSVDGVVQSGLEVNIAHPTSSQHQLLPSVCFVYMWISHLNVVFLTNVIFVIRCFFFCFNFFFWKKKVF